MVQTVTWLSGCREKLVRSVSSGFRKEKMVQTVTWLSGLSKELAIGLVNESVSVKRSRCESTAHGIYPVSVVSSHVISSVTWSAVLRRQILTSDDWLLSRLSLYSSVTSPFQTYYDR